MSLVIATPDVVGERMAGPGIRAYHFATELGKLFPTTLVADFREFVSRDEPFRTLQRGTVEARGAIENAKVVVGQPTREVLASRREGAVRIYDLFDPVVLELRELYGQKPKMRQSLHLRLEWGRLRYALESGDVLISGTPRQRDFYAGVHAPSNPVTDRWEERWIDVPFGLEETPPTDEAPAIDSTDPIVVWGGGTWQWLDPDTAIAAVNVLNERGVRCKLLFLGASRPHEGAAVAARPPRAAENVIVNDEWVPYRSRARWLRASKVAIMLHRSGLEAEFSIRTRLFDAIWCGLPIVATSGGFAADLVQNEGLGVVVAPSDPHSVAAGIEQLLESDALYARCVSNLEQMRPRYYWRDVVRPLAESIANWIK